jgi:NADH dehydrogenase FAD-containing subunit
LIEIGGHDHFADLRFHSSWDIVGLDNTPNEFKFHNLLIAPGVSPNKGQNPGVATFEITFDRKIQNLRMEFLDL